MSSRDLRRNLGANVSFLREVTGLDPWESTRERIRDKLIMRERREVEEVDHWRLNCLRSLLNSQTSAHYNGQFEEEASIQELIDSLVIN